MNDGVAHSQRSGCERTSVQPARPVSVCPAGEVYPAGKTSFTRRGGKGFPDIGEIYPPDSTGRTACVSVPVRSGHSVRKSGPDQVRTLSADGQGPTGSGT